MEKYFVDSDVALLAESKGFNDECLATYYSYPYSEGVLKLAKLSDSHKMEVGMKVKCKAPIHQQVVDWLEEKHNIHVSRIWYDDGVTPSRWVYHIDGEYAGSDFNEALIEALKRIK